MVAIGRVHVELNYYFDTQYWAGPCWILTVRWRRPMVGGFYTLCSSYLQKLAFCVLICMIFLKVKVVVYLILINAPIGLI